MANVSEFTQVVLDLVQEVKGFREQARKAPAIPFMQQEVSARDARNRFAQLSAEGQSGMLQRMPAQQRRDLFKGLSTEQRQGLLRIMGSEQLLDMLRG